MNIIQNITDDPKQQLVIILLDGSSVTWTLEYRPQQQGWYYDVSWDGLNPPWQKNGNRLVASPNILRQHRLIIPFGLMISTDDNTEPLFQDAFSSGKALAILLDQADVLAVEKQFFPGL